MYLHRAVPIVGLAFTLSACGMLLGLGDDDEELPVRETTDAATPPDVSADVATEPRPDVTVDAPADVAPPRPRRVFVTGSRFDGALGGGLGADAKCAAAAAAAGLPGTFVAYVATDAGSAEARLGAPGQWFRTGDGARVFDAGPAFEATPAVPIDRTEDGGVVAAPVFVWTGNALPSAGESTCADWTATTGFGGYGKADTNGAEWRQGLGTTDCAEPQRLYCFEL